MTEQFSLPVNFFGLNQDKKFNEIIRHLLSNYQAFAGDFLITFGRALTFTQDEKFMKCLKEHPEPLARSLAWRLHTACWAAKRALLMPGDFVECGVENAITATQIVNYLDFENVDKQLYLYDTFCGIPDSYMKKAKLPGINHYDKNIDKNYNKICQRFAPYKNIHITKGQLPESLVVICPEKIAFLHLDLSNFPSEYDLLEALLPKMVPGGIVLFQSFGFAAYEVYKIQHAKYLTEKGLPILELPTGQGLLIV